MYYNIPLGFCYKVQTSVRVFWIKCCCFFDNPNLLCYSWLIMFYLLKQLVSVNVYSFIFLNVLLYYLYRDIALTNWSQCLPFSSDLQSHIRIWHGVSLSTYAVIGLNVFLGGILSINFASDVSNASLNVSKNNVKLGNSYISES